jgi:hypothetical protein
LRIAGGLSRSLPGLSVRNEMFLTFGRMILKDSGFALSKRAWAGRKGLGLMP